MGDGRLIKVFLRKLGFFDSGENMFVRIAGEEKRLDFVIGWLSRMVFQEIVSFSKPYISSHP